MKKTTYVIAGVVLTLAGAYVLFAPQPAETPVIVTEDSARPAPTDNAAGSISAGLVGVWISEDDALYSVSYGADGSLSERYDSEENPVYTVGTWRIEPDESGEVMLKTSVDGGEYVYTIVEFDGSRMTIRERQAAGDNHFVKKQ